MRLTIEDRRTDLLKALMGGDELGLVIRAHIHVEHQLIEFINKMLIKPGALDDPRIGFSARVRFALALGLPEHLIDPLNALNRLRNDFAHKLGTALIEDTVQQFYATFDHTMKEGVRVSWERMRTSSPHPVHPTSIDAACPRDRLVIYAINVWTAVAAEVQRLDSDKCSPE